MSDLKTEVWEYECPCCYASYEPEDKPKDGRCVKCDDAPNLREKQSEFGAGLVVCIAKFSEHLWTERDAAIYELVAFKDGKRTHAQLSTEAQHRVDFAERWWLSHPEYRRADTPLDAAIAEQIEMWASGAADHFADLDEERAPEPLKELAAVMWRLRNRHLNETPLPTGGDMETVKRLWQESCIALDRMLGTVPNWGEW
jgi:hypothetical protein